jgi:hypothetical protein
MNLGAQAAPSPRVRASGRLWRCCESEFTAAHRTLRAWITALHGKAFAALRRVQDHAKARGLDKFSASVRCYSGIDERRASSTCA